MTEASLQKFPLGVEADDLARRFRHPLLKYFRRRFGSQADAEDLTQEVFVRILRRASGEHIEKVGNFIFTAAGNLARDHARAQRGHSNVLVEEISVDEVGVLETCTPDRVLMARERLAEVLACLDELPPRTRDAFLLFRVEQIRQREIGLAMGISVSAVEKHIARASAHLAQCLAPEEMERAGEA